MPYSGYPNGITSFGVPVMGNFPTFGDVYFVDYRNGLDGNTGKEPTRALKTLSAAYAKVTSNQNDVIYIDGDSTVVETSKITWAKNRVHVVGLNGPPGHYGAGAKVSIGVTTDTSDTALIEVTGVRNTFTGIKFMSANTLTEALYCVADAGEYTRYFNCEFYHSGQAAVTTAAEVLGNGDSSMFYNCTFGALTNSVTANGAHPNIMFDREQVTGKVARDNYFENCLFLRNAADADNVHIHTTAANDCERMMMFKDCTFMNNVLGTTMTVAITNVTTNAYFLFKNCTELGHTDFCADADTTTYCDGPNPVGTTTGQAVLMSAA